MPTSPSPTKAASTSASVCRPTAARSAAERWTPCRRWRGRRPTTRAGARRGRSSCSSAPSRPRRGCDRSTLGTRFEELPQLEVDRRAVGRVLGRDHQRVDRAARRSPRPGRAARRGPAVGSVVSGAPYSTVAPTLPSARVERRGQRVHRRRLPAPGDHQRAPAVLLQIGGQRDQPLRVPERRRRARSEPTGASADSARPDSIAQSAGGERRRRRRRAGAAGDRPSRRSPSWPARRRRGGSSRGDGSRRAANSRDRRVCSGPSFRKSASSERITAAGRQVVARHQRAAERQLGPVDRAVGGDRRVADELRARERLQDAAAQIGQQRRGRRRRSGSAARPRRWRPAAAARASPRRGTSARRSAVPPRRSCLARSSS